MKEKSITIIIAVLVAVLASFGDSAAGQDYTHIWIDQTTGSNEPDTPGTPEEPFKSITYGLARAGYLGWPEPWHIHIGPGVYDADPAKPAFERELFPISLREGMIFEGSDSSDPNNRTIDPNVHIIDGHHLTQGYVSILYGSDLMEVQIGGLTLQNMNHTQGNGGAIELINCAGRVENCIIKDNSASGGGGLWLSPRTDPIPPTFDVVDCTFTNNSASGDYGAGFSVFGSLNGSITSCNFTNNSAGSYGGGFYVDSLTGSITGCRFTSNSGYYCGGFCVGSLTGSVTGCSFTNNLGSCHGGGFLVGDSLTGSITGCSFTNNSAGYYGGGFYVNLLTGSITDCSFVENSGSIGEAVYVGGGKISNCIFSGHNVNAVAIERPDLPTKIRSCLFVAPQELGDVLGWAIKAHQETVILNNTMVGPGGTPEALASAIYIECGAPPELGMIFSNIIVDTKRAIQIVPSAGDTRIEYNQFDNVADIVCQGEQGMGNDLWWLEWNLDKFRNNKYGSPLFVGGDAMHHIQESSPCVDAGDPNYAADMGEIDIDGQPRIGAGRVDIGADEYYKCVLTADIYFDGIVNFLDFAVLAGYRQSGEPLADIAPDGGDGVVDLLDLARLCEEWLQKEDWHQGP